MRKVWKRETYVRSQSFSSESAVKYLHVGRREIQISLPPGEQDQSNALPQGQQKQSNPQPMPCLPPRRRYIDRCITFSLLADTEPVQIQRRLIDSSKTEKRLRFLAPHGCQVLSSFL